MSMFDEPSRSAPPPPPMPQASGRTRALLITVGVVLALVVALSLFSQFWTEKLWYDSVSASGVFSTMIWMKLGLFCVFGVLMAAMVGINLYVGYRFRPFFVPTMASDGLDRYRQGVAPIKTWLLVAISILMGVFAGISAAGQWRSFALWRNAVPFGTKDPQFDKDVGWYVFSLPWWHYVVDFAMAAAVIGLIAAVVVHYLYGGIRLQARGDRLSGAAQAQLSVLLGVFVLAKAIDYWLDRYDLMNASGGTIDGITYTGEHAVLPAKNILLGISLVCAVLFFLNVWRRTWLLPSVGISLLALSAVLLGMVWPGLVQKLQVDPSIAEKEGAYIAKNITATRQAYDVADTSVTGLEAASGAAGKNNGTTGKPTSGQTKADISAVPVVDPKVAQRSFEQNQQWKAYYSVNDVLDVDRYTIDDQQRLMVLGVRELDQRGIADADRNWNNLHTVYTHGDGLIAAYANQRPSNNTTQVATSGDEDTTQWAEGRGANEKTLSSQFGDKYEGRVYYGEMSPDYSIVGKSKTSDSVELALPRTAGDDASDVTSYAGQGGVEVGSTFRKLLYAIKFSEPKILLSDRVHNDSKIIYDRNPREMVEKVAPWLTVDNDPYPALIDGRITWILDGYTVTDRYPQAQKGSLEDMTDDSSSPSQQFSTLPTDEINYMRNSVKATVDAYDGTVTLYEWHPDRDEVDPILKAWEGAFPGLLKPQTDIPDALLPHLRYPEDMFKVQRYQLARYHVTDEKEWLEGRDRWDVPVDPNNSTKLQPPYRMFVDPKGQVPATDDNAASTADQVYSLTSVYTPRKRGQLAAFVSVNSDATSPSYGTFTMLSTPDESTDGPNLVAQQIASNTTVNNQLLSLKNSGLDLIYGNLLTLPIDDQMLFVQPLYTERANSDNAYPILRYIMVSYGGQVGISTTLVGAVGDMLDVDTTTSPGSGNGGSGGNEKPGGGGGSEQPTTGLNAQIAAKLVQAEAKFKQADEFQKQGSTVKWARANEQARKLIEEAIALSEKR